MLPLGAWKTNAVNDFGRVSQYHHFWKQPIYMWVFPKIGVSQNVWFIMENPIKMDDLGVIPFWKHPYVDDFYFVVTQREGTWNAKQ